jgi:hypothetical protein
MTTETLVQGYVLTNTPKDLFTSKEHYLSFVQAWRKYANSPEGKTLSTSDFILYAFFRGKDWRKGFTPCKKQIKLNNGHHPYWGAYNGFQSLRFRVKYHPEAYVTNHIKKIFGDTITKEMIDSLMKYLPEDKDFRSPKSIKYDMLPEIPYKEVL